MATLDSIAEKLRARAPHEMILKDILELRLTKAIFHRCGARIRWRPWCMGCSEIVETDELVTANPAARVSVVKDQGASGTWTQKKS